MTIPTLADTLDIAERVHVTERHDLFAAAVLADEHLRRLERGAPLLHTPAERHRWRLAQNTLREAVRKARRNPQLADGLDVYPVQLARYHDVLGALQGSPQRFVSSRKAALRAIDSATPRRIALLLAFAGLLAAILAVPRGGSVAIAGASFVAASWGVAFVLGRIWRRRNRAAGRARAELQRAWVAATAYAELLADPACGQWLQMIWERHPLLLAEPPPRPARQVSAVFPVQKIRSVSGPGEAQRLG